MCFSHVQSKHKPGKLLDIGYSSSVCLVSLYWGPSVSSIVLGVVRDVKKKKTQSLPLGNPNPAKKSSNL